MQRLTTLLFAVLSSCSLLFGQDVIHLKNPSFEDAPRHSKAPRGWNSEGFLEESPSDIHPGGNFGVNSPARDGRTYVGMVVRDNETWECVGQRLEHPLRAYTCYLWSVALMRSPEYISISRTTNLRANFNKPCVLRVWGGKTKGKGMELLNETEPVDHEAWEEYKLLLEPSDTYDYIYLEAYYYYGGEELLPYNGNLLVDHCSPIVPCNIAEPEDDLYQYEK